MNELYTVLAQRSGLNQVIYGQEIALEVYLALAHDKSMPSVIKNIEERKMIDKVRYGDKLHVTVDHFIPAPSKEKRASFINMKKFCNTNNIKIYSHGEGVMHQIVAEKFADKINDKVVVGVDGHVCTSGGLGGIPFSITADEMIEVLITGKYKISVPEVIKVELYNNDIDEDGVYNSITGKDIVLYMIKEIGKKELVNKGVVLTGKYLEKLSKSQRMTIANMLGEIGAKTCYFSNRAKSREEKYHNEFTINVNEISDMIALPGSPDNIKHVNQVLGRKISQVFIGGCTNGKLDDIEITANILEGEKVHSDVTLIVCPASKKIANDMDRLGYSGIIRESGGIIINPGCGACAGAHQGVLSEDDVILTTTARNTSGRMGAEEAEIFLVSPKIAAISAIAGKIDIK